MSGMFSLSGRRALVTGASGGIGSAIVRALHAQGAEVVLTGRKLTVSPDVVVRDGFYAPGTVLALTPAPGSQVRAGTRVALESDGASSRLPPHPTVPRLREPDGELDDFRPGHPVVTTHPRHAGSGPQAPRCGLPGVTWRAHRV